MHANHREEVDEVKVGYCSPIGLKDVTNGDSIW